MKTITVYGDRLVRELTSFEVEVPDDFEGFDEAEEEVYNEALERIQNDADWETDHTHDVSITGWTE
jgi:hypothetical protein